MDGVHDLGGMHGFGAVVEPGSDDVFHADWEPRLFGLWAATYAKRLLAGNGRYWREQMEPAHYLAAGYYERWLWSTERQLVASGAITREDVDAAAARLAQATAATPTPTALGDRAAATPRHGAKERDQAPAEAMRAFLDTPEPLHQPGSPRFHPGDRVRVVRMRPIEHNRCPRYVRGATGIVEGVHGGDRVPEGSGEVRPVYLVAFRSEELFGPTPEPGWTVTLDLWEHYLELAPEGAPAA